MRCYESRTFHGSACVPAGSHIVFLGCSVLRYQFLMLAYSLFTGREYNRTPGMADLLYNEDSWGGPGGWPRFLEQTTRLFDKEKPHMRCDCYRANNIRGYDPKIVENRYFSYGGVQLTYLELFGRLPMQGFWWPGDKTDARHVHSSFDNIRWQHNLTYIIQHLLPLLVPTHLVLQIGGPHLALQQRSKYPGLTSGPPFLTQSELESLDQSLAQASLAKATTFKAYTSDQMRSQPPPSKAELAVFGPRILDAFTPTRRLKSNEYMDNIHFNLFGNHLTNWMLLQHLFPQHVHPIPGQSINVQAEIDARSIPKETYDAYTRSKVQTGVAG